METDEQIYLRFTETDDDTYLEALLTRHREGLFLFLLSFVRSAEDAEELLMDVFAKLAVDKPPFEPGHSGSFKSWLYTIARRKALMLIRKRKYATVPLEDDVRSDAALPEVELLNGEKNQQLYRALSSIDPGYRRALYLLYFEGMSHNEIAKVMRIRLKQVYNLVERGKKALKKALERMGITDAQY